MFSKKTIFLLLLVALGSVPSFAQREQKKRSQKAETSIRPPMMGWSSWNTYRVNINQELIKRQAKRLVDLGLKELGYIYINIDDGFFGQRDAYGEMQAHSGRFPDGMRAVSDYIHALGLKAGIYSDAGNNTCGSVFDNDANGIGAGLYGHEQQDLDLYLLDWNFDFIKIDFCGGDHLGLDERQRYNSIYNSIRNTGRKDVLFNICRWAFPGAWAKDIAYSWRIDGDIWPNWASVKQIIDKNLYLSAYAGEGHYNDMDMLEINRGLTPNQEQVHFGMWCIMSSPLMIGCDMTSIQESSLNLIRNKELIALNQDVLGLQAYVAQKQGEGYVLVKDVERLHGNKRAVALYNPSDSLCRFDVCFADLDLGGTVFVRDLVAQCDKGEYQDSITVVVEPNSVAIWSVNAEQRLERTSYEGECAYLPSYDALPDAKNRRIYYALDAACSGGVKIARLGAKIENRAIWRDVYSQRGGRYTMTIYFQSPTNRNLDVYINGKKQELKQLNSGNSVSTTTITADLEAGINTIEMGNDYDWAPDIDKFTLKKQL